MILYVNGDSNSSSHGKFWTEQLKTHLACDMVNEAKDGGSNPRILRKTIEFFNEHVQNACDYFVVIGWTSWEREEWFYQDKYYQVNASGRDQVSDELKEKYMHWVADKDAISQVDKSKKLHQEIIDLHCFLKKLNVKHLFFNALMPFQHEALYNSDLRFDWGNNFIGPYENDLSYFWYLKKQGYQPDACYHYNQAAQICWGKFLIDYMNKEKILR